MSTPEFPVPKVLSDPARAAAVRRSPLSRHRTERIFRRVCVTVAASSVLLLVAFLIAMAEAQIGVQGEVAGEIGVRVRDDHAWEAAGSGLAAAASAEKQRRRSQGNYGAADVFHALDFKVPDRIHPDERGDNAECAGLRAKCPG